MTPVKFEQCNTTFGPPEGMAESQVMTMPVYYSQAVGGSVDGMPMVVVAWQPDARELAALNEGKPIFLTMMGGLAPHFLSVSFEEASKPA